MCITAHSNGGLIRHEDWRAIVSPSSLHMRAYVSLLPSPSSLLLSFPPLSSRSFVVAAFGPVQHPAGVFIPEIHFVKIASPCSSQRATTLFYSSSCFQRTTYTMSGVKGMSATSRSRNSAKSGTHSTSRDGEIKISGTHHTVILICMKPPSFQILASLNQSN